MQLLGKMLLNVPLPFSPSSPLFFLPPPLSFFPLFISVSISLPHHYLHPLYLLHHLHYLSYLFIVFTGKDQGRPMLKESIINMGLEPDDSSEEESDRDTHD